MRIRIYLLMVFLCGTLSAQNSNINSFVSQEQTVNGFSNFRLGTNLLEPYIAANPNDPSNIICGFINGSYYTLDDLNWSALSQLNSTDPFVTFDSLGTAYYSPAPPGLLYFLAIRRSTDKGITWSGNFIIQNATSDKPCICANKSGGIYSNYLYSAWQYYPYGTYYSRSTDFGATWSAVNLINPGNNFMPYIAIGPSQTYPGAMVYYGNTNYVEYPNDTVYKSVIRVSSDAGSSFSGQMIISELQLPLILKGGLAGNNPGMQIAADNSYGPHRGNVYVVYGAKGTGNDKSDILFTRSTNFGTNWSVPYKLNDDNTTNDQWYPAIAADRNGRLYVIWYDSREDPSNYLIKVYGTVSNDGGETFSPDFPVSNADFTASGMGLGWLGHYISVSAAGNSAIASWTDGRNGFMDGYVGYLPDFAMTATTEIFLGSNDSAFAVIKIPSVKGPYTGGTKFTCALDSLPPQGTVGITYQVKDSITSVPDSVRLKIKLTNVTSSGIYRLIITGRNTSSGVPVHRRIVYLMINTASLNIGSNRNGSATYKVNDSLYNTQKRLNFAKGTNITVQAVSPISVTTNTRYVFTNWSDTGDTTHSFVINSDINLTAYYKTQFKLFINSAIGNTFGGNTYYDSSQTVNFGVTAKRISYNGHIYIFSGWNGIGENSYTSQDSSGNDTSITLSLKNSIIEVARWTQSTGITQEQTEIPAEFTLRDAYPNPFNPEVNIKFGLPEFTHARLVIYDILGKEIAVLINGNMKAGYYVIHWKPERLPSGIYFYRLETDAYTATKRMLLIK